MLSSLLVFATRIEVDDTVGFSCLFRELVYMGQIVSKYNIKIIINLSNY